MRPWSALVSTAAICLTFGYPQRAAAQTTAQSIRYVANVVDQFNALTVRPDAMGFEISGPDPSQCRHMQGVLRIEAADGTPYLLVSRSGKDTGIACTSGNPRANVYIVRMGSRAKDGERLRSNRLRKGMETTNTPPETEDRVLDVMLFDGTSDWPHYEHPGGMQQVGNIVALALEEGRSGYPSTKILFIDVSDPEHPVMLNNSFDPPTSKAGVVGITPCATGRATLPCATGHYLMLVTGGDNDELLFFESSTGDLKHDDLTWTLLDRWGKDELIGGEWPAGHQTLHFIREGGPGGPLFLAGARGAGTTVEGLYADDYIDLYRVGFEGSTVKLTHQSTRHLISHPTGEGNYVASEDEVAYGARLASFMAASGFHVTPTGELLFYATEHDNDGPEGSNGRSTVKFGEWRHIDMFRPDSPAFAPTLTAPGPVTIDEGSTLPLSATAAPPIAKPWIQLYEELDFNFGSRFVVVDYDDRNKDNFDNFRHLDRGYEDDLLRFDNSASAWRWFAPRFCAIRANDQPIGGTGFPGPQTKTLIGTGVREFDPSLHEVKPDGGVGEMFREVASVQFSLECDSYYNTPPAVRWDLDFDGVAETIGTNVTLSAADSDGPSHRDLIVEARQSVDITSAVRTVSVTVLNVNPVVESWLLMTADGRRIGLDVPFAIQHRPIRGFGTFKDAGRLDHQTASVAWGDGSTSSSFTAFSDAFGGVEGRLETRHTYSATGTFNLALTVKDDDDGVGDATAPLTVVSPADAVRQAIAMLDALIATATEPARSSLLAARRALAGSGQSGASSGALAKIEKNLMAAAVAKLKNAIRDLGRVADVDVTVITAVLEEVAAAMAD
jgi:hypothetical protein